jgi:carboxymethylenebutenolidase
MAWLATINDVVDQLSKLPITESESMGVLGFSQGGYLAVGVAGTNRRIKALAEFYGGFPARWRARSRSCPQPSSCMASRTP